MVELPDIQDQDTEIPIPINRVGFKNIKMPAGKIQLHELEIIVVPTFNVYIDLPTNKRAIHVSRLYHAVIEVIKENSGKIVKLEEIGRKVGKKLLDENQQSSKAYVNIESNAYYKTESPITKYSALEPFKIYVKTRAAKNSNEIKISESIGVEATGLTACPCAREVIKTVYQGLETTHMQRSKARVFIQSSSSLEIDVVELLNIVRSSFSSPSYPYLKRIDEAKIVRDSLESARFVEDTLREIVKKIVEKWSNLPDDSRIYAYIESIESIHPQNIAACVNLDIEKARIFLKKAGVDS